MKYKCHSIQWDRVCHRYTHKWKRATITLGWVASKQINYLWTMNIAYCAQNCCCLSFIRQQIWFTGLDIHYHGSWILITFSTSAHRVGKQPTRTWYLCHSAIKNVECIYFIKIKKICVKLFAFLDMQHKYSPSIGHWKRFSFFLNLKSRIYPCLYFFQPWPIKNVFPAASHHVVSLYFHPTLPSDVPTLKSNRVVKQSLKQPLCNHWLFYFALWFRCRVIMALPSAHLVVL